MLKSAIHIHSTYSDGEFSLNELRNLYSSLGCKAIFMTDHAEFFDAAKVQKYKYECEKLSDENFQFVPGLEFTCDKRMHILGLGVTSLTQSTDPQEVIQHIKLRNGVAIIAHPLESIFSWILSFEELPHGIEVWNTKYDGRYAPRPETFKFLYEAQNQDPSISAFYGQDLHWKNQYTGLFTNLQSSISTMDSYLESLKYGNYSACKRDLFLPSSGKLPQQLLNTFSRFNHFSVKKRSILKAIKKQLDRSRINIPSSVKTNLRRIF